MVSHFYINRFMTAVSGIFLNHVSGSIYLQRKILEPVRPIERIILWTPAWRAVVSTGLGLNSPKHSQPDSLRHLQTVVFRGFQHPEGLCRFHDSLFMTAPGCSSELISAGERWWTRLLRSPEMRVHIGGVSTLSWRRRGFSHSTGFLPQAGNMHSSLI